jgi:uncharacterized membrane protein
MTAIHWIIGPQLLGVIFLIAGYIQKWYPPKTINGLYGYRTDSSMKNQQTWDEANRYSTRIMIRYAWIMLTVGIAITLPMEFIRVKEDVFTLIKVSLMIAGSLIMVVVLISSTEKHLRETFDDKPL